MQTYYSDGSVHNDNHKEQNITVNGNVTGDVIRKLTESFFSDAEEVAPMATPRQYANAVPSVFDTPEARALWQKLHEAGWVDEKWQPTNRLKTKVSKSVLANVIANKLQLPSPMYEPFESLWNEEGLLTSYAAGNTNEKNNILKDEIRKSLK